VVEGEGCSRKIGCSIGVAQSEPGDRTVESLIDRADHALYVAKANGRGQVKWFGATETTLLSHDAPGEFVSAHGI
jgi:PleD family two-component response regulator